MLMTNKDIWPQLNWLTSTAHSLTSTQLFPLKVSFIPLNHRLCFIVYHLYFFVVTILYNYYPKMNFRSIRSRWLARICWFHCQNRSIYPSCWWWLVGYQPNPYSNRFGQEGLQRFVVEGQPNWYSHRINQGKPLKINHFTPITAFDERFPSYFGSF